MYEKCGIIILFYYCLRASFYKTGYDKKLLIEIVILSVILCSNYGLCIATHVPSNITIRQEPGICPSIDVRNSVEMFSKLKGCKVVEGFVSIALIDNINLNDYRNITFPELREITGYLLLYRVYALKSIGKLFPKLSVIRGHTLFLNYALLVFEMLNLQELGLVSLTNILRGSVYIAKNPMLCFVHTINWNLIAPESNEFKYITGNKLRNECPVCSVELNCPTSGNTGEALCWNVDHCQIVCPKHCGGSCNADGKCCHLECLGGCDAGGQSSDHCFSCRNVLFENKCISKCPANTYKYLNRRCVYESECYDMPKPREINKYNIKPNPWKPFRNECVLECPSNFLEVDIGISGQQKLSCELCEGNCRKECPGAKIDSPASAMTMRGCTLIRGSLEIQMRGGSNIVRELEDNLSSIEEITGYLKVVRSFALLSLNFLKKLKVIHGEILESSIYSLVILDNQNLMELWDWDKRERIFNIKSGRLFFHFNPKLCRSKIDELKEIANLSDYSELEVASNSNGHKVACNVTRLKAFIEKKSSVVAIVHWTQFEHYDPRKVLGYMVYYIEAPFRNITMFGGRDACGGDEWKVIDVSADENVTERGFHQTIITKLKPYTQYAYYVKTYTIASEKTGAISPIQYFRTNASTPSPPRSLNAYSNSSSELVITWLPPSEPNGNGTHYKLTAIWVRDTDEFVEQRNYCNEPPAILDTRTTPPTSSQEAQIPPEDNQEDFQMKYCPSCGCAPKKVNSDNREKEIKFEDSLQNFVYIKREQRVKRDVDNTEENMNHEFPASGVVRDTQYVITHLRHFSLYTVKVRACREVDIEEYASNNSSRKCSVEAVVTARTQSLASADNIDFNSTSWETSNLSVGAVNLKWKEPMSPNSVIVTYQIEYKRVDVPNLKPTIECITKKDFEKSGKIYTLSNLHSGNYSFRLRATSLAGPGEFTPYKYFTIQESISFSIYQLYGIILTCIVLASFVCVTVLYVRRQNRIPSRKLIASVNPEYVPTVYEPDDWEVARARVEILREIGQGSFGMVYEGILKSIDGNTECRCAVKTVNVQAADRDRIEFLNEASVMKAFNTQHVVKLLGVVSQGQPTLVIMELMGRGDLKSYLRSLRPENAENVTVSPPTQKRILRMAAEIADGMAYLAAKKFVHRDLAARNCMVADDLTVKIGDFGMTRDIYETEYYRKGSKGLLPVRWMAPESLKDGVFTSFSDAWSYGVVLYEMVTLASQPYQGLSNDQVLRYVIDGGIMSRPERCPDKLYTVMRLCWDVNPTNRPTFLELIEFLEPDIDKSFSQVSFYHSAEGREARSFAQPSLQTSELTPLTLSREGDDFSYSDAEDGYREASTSSKYSNASTPLNQYGLSTQSHQNYSPNNIDLHTTSC